jgi:hypothetical protein
MIILSISIEGIATEDHSVYEENKMISKQFINIYSAKRKKIIIILVLSTVISNGTITLRRKDT